MQHVNKYTIQYYTYYKTLTILFQSNTFTIFNWACVTDWFKKIANKNTYDRESTGNES